MGLGLIEKGQSLLNRCEQIDGRRRKPPTIAAICETRLLAERLVAAFANPIADGGIGRHRRQAGEIDHRITSRGLRWGSFADAMRSASIARPRLNRWRRASLLIPHAAAASVVLRPSTATNNNTSR